MKRDYDKLVNVSLIGGFIFMILVHALKHYAQTPTTVASVASALVFGAVVGLLATTPKDSFVKNIVFIGAFAWLIWAFLSPVSVVGNSLIIQRTELLTVITVFIIFLEADFWNIFRRMKDHKTKFGLGFVGIIFLSFLMSRFGIGAFFMKHWYLIIILSFGFLIYAYFGFVKSTNKLLERLKR